MIDKFVDKMCANSSRRTTESMQGETFRWMYILVFIYRYAIFNHISLSFVTGLQAHVKIKRVFYSEN